MKCNLLFTLFRWIQTPIEIEIGEELTRKQKKNVISSVQMIKFGLFRFDSNKCELFENQLHPD